MTVGRLRVGLLEAAGYQTVGRVHQAEPYDLQRVPGIGGATAARAKAAAAALARAALEATTVRIDPNDRTTAATELVTALYLFVQASPALPATCAQSCALRGTLKPLLEAAAPARGRTAWWFTRAAPCRRPRRGQLPGVAG